MKNSQMIDKNEFVFLAANVIGLNSMLQFPKNMAQLAGTAAWLLSLIIILFAFLGVVILYKLYEPFNGKDILEIANVTGGRALEMLIGFLVLVQIIYGGAVVARQFGESLNIIALSNSPVEFVIFLLMIGAGIVACLGLKTIARLSYMVTKVIMVGIILILVGVINKFKIVNLYPILGYEGGLTIKNGFLGISWFSGVLLYFLLIPFLKDKNNSKKVLYKTVGLSGLFMFLVTFIYQGVFSYPGSTKQFLPLYALSRSIKQGGKIERIEAVFLIVWVIAALTFITVDAILVAYVFKRLFRLKYYKPIVLSGIIIIFSLSLMYKNLLETPNNFVHFYRRTSYITSYIVPLILLIFANIKKGGQRWQKK